MSFIRRNLRRCEREQRAPEFHVKPSACPFCARMQNGASRLLHGNKTPPEPGDVTVCDHCGSALHWDAEMNLEALDWSELSTEEAEVLRRAQAIVKKDAPS